MVALLVFIMATSEIVFGRKQTGVNFFKNSARNIYVNLTAPACWDTGVFKYRYALFVSVVS